MDNGHTLSAYLVLYLAICYNFNKRTCTCKRHATSSWYFSLGLAVSGHYFQCWSWV